MKILLLFVFLRVFLLSHGYSQTLNLALNLPEGYRFNTETTVNMIVEQEFMGIRYNTQMDIVTLLQMEVRELTPDSNYILSASYEKMDIRVSSILINMEVSSETTFSGDSLSGILKLLRGKEFEIEMSHKSEISDIRGIDELIIETVGSGSLPEDQKAEFTRNLIQSIGKEAIQDNYRSNASFYPGKSIKTRDQWETGMNLVKSGIPMYMNSRIRIKEIKGNEAILTAESKLVPQKPGSRESIDAAENQFYNFSGNEVSEKRMDTRTGLILESIISQNIAGTIRTPSPEEGGEEIVIPFKIISRSSILNSPAKQ